MNEAFPIVGIGASAGGIEAMRSFFHGLPQATGAAFVVVTHMNPERDSLLPEVLARFTALPVEVAADDTPVRPDRVYVMAPGTLLGFRDGRLTARGLDPAVRETKPIDVFLTALALDQGERAVAVILSGGDGDGAIGVKAVKEHGGLTLAQAADDDGPETPDMPLSALRTGFVDHADRVERMGARIAAYRPAGAHPAPDASNARPAAGIDADLLGEIYAILLAQVGHDFSGYKTSTFLRRLHRRIGISGAAGPGAYLDRLRADPAEAAALFRDLLISVTKFFRDADAFDALAASVVPTLFAGRDAGETVRVWVPACSTGEEVYSLAILLREYADTLATPPRVQIFATDIDERSLVVARLGRYPRAYLDAVSPERIARHFTVEGESVVIDKAVRALCTFAPHSVLRDPPFSRLDLISCRNLLIYLGVEAQRQVMPVLHYALRPDGHLFIGTAENVTRFEDLFETVDKRHRIFRARDTILPVRLPALPGPEGPLPAQPAAPLRRRDTTVHAALRHAVDAQMLAEFTAPHAVVTRAGEAVHYSARIGAHLEVAPGQPTRELAAMARKGLRLELRTALREAIEGNVRVERAGLEVELPDGRVQRITLVVRPLHAQTGSEPLFLVVFDEAAPAVERVRRQALAETEQDGAVLSLERELATTRERLQAVIEEYETSLEELKSSNEELSSVNEEMQSANEELEAAREETQSINEELQTVNGELASKIEALDQMNDDQAMLFETTNIASVFLTLDLRIRMFTAAAAGIFGLRTGDIGRPLATFAAPFPLGWLAEEAPAVMEGDGTFERTIAGTDGSHYRVRLTASARRGFALAGFIVNFTKVSGDGG